MFNGHLDLQPRLPRITFPANDVRSRLSPDKPCVTIAELSPALQALLPIDFSSQDINNLLETSDIVFKSEFGACLTILRVSESISVKISARTSAPTEIRSLLYLQKNLPHFLAPTPHGLLRIGKYYLLFMEFIPGISLEKAWPELNDSQKAELITQLDTSLSALRSLPHPPDTPLGPPDTPLASFEGYGCSDLRRFLRISDQSIMTSEQFDDFIFSGITKRSFSYVQFLRSLKPTRVAPCVFTHGDIRPANIMVRHEDSAWKIVSFVDWESSGFYPEHWESVKMTNNLCAAIPEEWYAYLSRSLVFRQCPIDWLVDRLIDPLLNNN